MTNAELTLYLFIAFILGTILSYFFFHHPKDYCENYEDSIKKLKDACLGYYQLFTVINIMFEDGIEYDLIKETVSKTHAIISKAERNFYEE